jgi:hypothetical protein
LCHPGGASEPGSSAGIPILKTEFGADYHNIFKGKELLPSKELIYTIEELT